MSITAALLDSREPIWVQNLTFGGVPTAIMQLATGDVHALCDDGNTLVIERKSSDDLLNTLRDERLLPQMARMVEARLDEQIVGDLRTWPYLVITGQLYRGPNGTAITGDRGVTGWNWNSVMGALLTIQEMGVFVAFAGGDDDFENAVIRLANRKREPIKLLPPRPPTILGPGVAFLASLPGIGPEHALRLLEWSAGNAAQALTGLTDLSIDCPLPLSTRRRARAALGLKDNQTLEYIFNNQEQPVLSIGG